MKIEVLTRQQYEVEIINSIQKKYGSLRQKSKTISFAAQYGGSWRTFVNSGFPEKEAKQLEINYHKLFQVSDAWIQTKLVEATNTGYVIGAFGLRIRTPILKQTILGNRNTPYEASQEARTAGNAVQQGYGQLNNRAAIELQERILNSKYALDIKPIAHVHDSQYFLIRDKIGLVEWFNKNLIECMKWDNLPELKHDIVKLNAELSIHYPTWSNSIDIPNNASKKEILSICRNKDNKV